MRIIYTHRTRGLGAEGVHIQGMVEAFRDLGHEVIVDCLPGCDPGTNQDLAPEPGLGAPGVARNGLGRVYRWATAHAPAAVFGMLELLYNAPLAARLGGRLRSRPGLVYERYAVGNFAPTLLCRLARVPIVQEVNDSVVIERSRATSMPRVKRWLEARVLGGAALVITVTEHFRAELMKHHPGLSADRILVLPNAVSARRFPPDAPDPAAARLRSRHDLGRRRLIGTTGQFLRWHGLAPLIAATADLARARDLGYLFIGDGPAREEVEEAARSAGVADRVCFTGMVPASAVPAYLALLDVAVIPASNAHCSPMKLLEFMAAGLPVLAPDLPNIREVLTDGRTGRLFRPDDGADLGRQLGLLLDDPAGGRSLGQRARAHVMADRTWGSHARSILGAVGPAAKPYGAAEVDGKPCIS